MLAWRFGKTSISRHYSTQTSQKKGSCSSQYCLDLIRQYDYENFLCTLLLQNDIRRTAAAIRAFNVEVAKISSSVSEQRIGDMRLKFWHDALNKIYDPKESRVPEHPVIKEIKLAVDKHSLSKLYFSRLIKARERSSNLPFITLKDMEQYAEETVSSVFHLLVKIVNKPNMNIDHAVSHLGKSQGIVNLLRGQLYQGRQKAVNIPQEILIKHGVSQERIIRDQREDKGVQDCIFEVASCANSHLEKAQHLSAQVPNEVKPLLLPAVAVSRYLERLRQANFRLSDTNLNRRDSLLPAAYYWSLFRNKY